MIKLDIKYKPFVEPNRPKQFGLDSFLNAIGEQIQSELSLLANNIYNYKKPEQVFAQNERAWVGILNNAIIRAFPDGSSTLQEFCVYDEHKFVGRADFLAHLNFGKQDKYLLFEAKQYEELSSESMHDDADQYLNSIALQAKKYLIAEDEYYKERDTYVIPIVFAWLRRSDVLAKAHEYFISDQKDDKSTDFCFFYYATQQGTENGAWCYGKIIPLSQLY